MTQRRSFLKQSVSAEREFCLFFCHSNIAKNSQKDIVIFSGSWSSSQNDFSDSECPNLGAPPVNDLQGCKDACLERTNCSAFNYKAVTTTCILRGCQIPVKGPSSDNHGNYDGYWLSFPGRYQQDHLRMNNSTGSNNHLR